MELLMLVMLFFDGLLAGWSLHAIVSKKAGRNV